MRLRTESGRKQSLNTEGECVDVGIPNDSTCVAHMFVYKQDGDLLKTLSSGLPLTGFVRLNTRKSR